MLIVEDDPLLLAYMDESLAPYGECVLAADGQVAVRAFREALTEGKPFDVIFMDLGLPGKDGHQALSEIRALETARGITPTDEVKTIIVSALDDTRHVSRAFFQGRAVSYLTKPVTPEKIASELEKFGYGKEA
jgi:two-component system chemotaxis response regulator CheY